MNSNCDSVRPLVAAIEGESVRIEPESDEFSPDARSSTDGCKQLNHDQNVEIEFDDDFQACGECIDQEESPDAIGVRKPTLPTQKEIDDHMLNHMPFRNWCPHCIRGRAKAHPHLSKSDEDRISSVPVVSIDYAFMSNRQVKGEEKGMPILVMKDRESKQIKSRVVPAKGTNGFAIQVLNDFLNGLGYRKVILKSDNEPAILALKDRAKKENTIDVVLESGVTHDSQTNGDIESGIQVFQGQFRTLKSSFESRVKRKLPGNHVLFAWLVSHASDIVSRFAKGEDGKTAYERIKGRSFKRPIVEWGEVVQYCKLGSAGENKSEFRWEKGCYLGHNDVTSEIIVGTELGIVKARDMKRYADSADSWNADFIFGIRGTPWQPIPGSNRVELLPEVIVNESKDDIMPELTGAVPPIVPRRMKITKEDIERIGITPNCEGCTAANRGLIPRNHSEECRAKHESQASSGSNPSAMDRKDRAQERLDNAIFRESKRALKDQVSKGEYKRFCRAPQNDEVKRNPRVIDNRTDDMEVNESNATEFAREDAGRNNPDKDVAMDVIMRKEINLIEWSGMMNHMKQINMVVKPECVVTYDANTGRKLDAELVRKARAEEMEYVHRMKVYEKVPLSMCIEETGKQPINVGWVDVNKGDDENPEIRCRIVGKEYNDQKRVDLFAATPPLESNKVLFSYAVTEGIGFNKNDEANGMKLMFLDISRAYYHSKARRRIFIKLPPEDAEDGMCGLMLKSLQGTRDAAQNWEFEYCEFLVQNGFTRGKSTPCIFYNEARELRVAVHGDDFTVLGYHDDLEWLKSVMDTKFAVKCRGIVGPSAGDSKSIKILNRVMEWTSEGIMYEPDQRHAELLVRDLGLNEKSKSVVTPGIKTKSEKGKDELDPELPLTAQDAAMFRAMTARANYLAQDRSDIQFAVKELCSKMSNPCNKDSIALKRLGRYLVGRTRMVHKFEYQGPNPGILGWSDSDWAGSGSDCSRKSTSGGVIMIGNHVVKTWASTQSTYALSSGEAEYYALVKCSSVAIGMKSMMKDFGITTSIRVNTDASAAIGIASRRGLGRIRHIDVDELWVQDKVAQGVIKPQKVKGPENLADTLTKHVTQSELEYHITHMNMRIVEGRHELMPRIIT